MAGGADRVQQRTISHTGDELGEGMVELKENQTEPQRESTIISFECPGKYDEISYVGRRHWTKLELRTLETLTADGGDTFALEANLQPVAGEEDLEDQPFPIVVGYNTTADEPIEEDEIAEVNYAQNEVVLEEAPASGDEIKFYPCISRGQVQYRGANQFGQNEGPADKWATPVYRWLDFNQDQRGTEVNLQGRIDWSRYEKLELVLDSAQNVVWEDEDYPRGTYVSHAEQRVDVHL